MVDTYYIRYASNRNLLEVPTPCHTYSHHPVMPVYVRGGVGTTPVRFARAPMKLELRLKNKTARRQLDAVNNTIF